MSLVDDMARRQRLWVGGPDDVRLDHRDVRRGRWAAKPPTNRRRKRQRCKARRRERMRTRA